MDTTDLVAEYLTKLSCASWARQRGEYDLAIAYDRQAMDRWVMMTPAQRRELEAPAVKPVLDGWGGICSCKS